MRKTHSCPSCGAPQPADNPGLVSFACGFCGTVFYLDEEKVQSVGKKSLLTEGFSRLYNGATGSFHQKRFRVIGRVRYAFTRGFWDEWFLELDDGSNVWITEDQHELCEQRAIEWNQQLAGAHFERGAYFTLDDRHYAVQESGQARCIGLEGALPKMIQVNEIYRYANATSLDGYYSLGVEFDDDPPSVYLGRWLRYNELKLDDEGMDW
ncbi:MAG: DUF4178 domain-containing protein [Acidobacteriota bacterium]